jgi:hypothetical protein
MNLEQIVKETVAKFVAEKKGKDLTGDGKIDSADYLKARSNAIEKAKNLDEDHKDHEVSMAQSSLNSILRSAMELKAKIGNQEIDIPAWIQDHITNSENFIDQASQGYHEYENGSENGEMDEVFIPKSSFDDFKIGDNVTVAGKKAKITNMKMDDESGERRARVRFEDGTAEEISINTIDENTMTTNEGRSAEDLKQGQLDQAYDHLEKIKEKPKLFSSEDIKKAEARIEKLEAELDALAAKATNESLDEATVRRWQHYAGIK